MLNRNNIFKFIIAGVAFLLLLFLVSSRFFPPLNAERFVLVQPLVRAADSLGKKVGLGRIAPLSSQEAADLVRENQQLKAEAFDRQKLEEDNLHLRAILGFKEEKKVSLKGADVIAFSHDLSKEFLIVNQGEDAGITIGNPVVDDSGILVGVVKDVLPSSAKVALVSDTGMTLEVELLPTHTRGLAKGIGGRVLAIGLLTGDAPIHPGDSIQAAGFLTHDHTPLQFLVGEVANVLGNNNAALKEAHGVLLVRPELLREVFIVSATR